MLNYVQTHLLIEQGLNTLGLFAEKANLHEQIDLAFNHVVVEDINRIVRLKPSERDAVEDQIATMLSREATSELDKEGQFYTSVWTPSFLLGDNVVVVLASLSCTEDDIELRGKPGIYKAKGLVTYNGKNYKDGSIFKITDWTKLTYGNPERMLLKDSRSIKIEASEFSFYAGSVTWGRGMPIVAFDATKIKVYYSRKDAIPVQIVYRLIEEIPENKKLDWCKKQDLALPFNIQHYYVEKVIAYLAVVNEKDQQNVINLKTETLT